VGAQINRVAEPGFALKDKKSMDNVNKLLKSLIKKNVQNPSGLVRLFFLQL
jgi:hypothetical protein